VIASESLAPNRSKARSEPSLVIVGQLSFSGATTQVSEEYPVTGVLGEVRDGISGFAFWVMETVVASRVCDVDPS
jgi:hypothetical protein